MELFALTKKLVQWGAKKIKDQCVIVGLSTEPVSTRNSICILNIFKNFVFVFQGRCPIHAKLEFDHIHFISENIDCFVYFGYF